MDERLPPPSASGLWAIVDCNNFFASCEQLIRPDLKDRPVVVLSNNDGCIVARSALARKLGIKMGTPAFRIRDFLERNGVEVFSSNFPLYNAVSRRVMDVLAHFCPKVEQYSIDEAFVYLDSALETQAADFCPYLIDRVRHYAGVPVSIGVARTRTLAKLACHVAKSRACGSFSLALPEKDIQRILADIDVGEIWGIGRKLGKKLPQRGIRTARDLLLADPWKMRRLFSVTLFDTILELRGVPMVDVTPGVSPRRTLVASRSFGQRVTELSDLKEAVATFTGSAMRRLRREGLLARCIEVFILTSRFSGETFYGKESREYLERYSCDTISFTEAAQRCLDRIYEPGHRYARAGVMLTELKRADQLEGTLLDALQPPLEARRARLMAVMDSINARCAQGTARLRLASEGNGAAAPWRMHQEHKSPDVELRWAPITEEPGTGPLFASLARKGFPPPQAI